jgi:hypothetical protein
MTDDTPTTVKPIEPTGPIALPSKYHHTTFELDGRPVPILISVLSLDTQQDLENGWQALRSQPGETSTPERDRANKLVRLHYCADAIAKYVSIPTGALIDPDEDNAPIVTGEQIVKVLGRRDDLMLALLLLILWENGVGPHERKLSKSALGSVIGWLTWVEPGVGPAPEPTAPSAEPTDSAPAAAVSETRNGSSSIAAPLPSNDAPSGV